MKFENKRTTEQFKAEKKTNKLFFRLAVTGNKESGYSPITYKDANGNDTGVQKVFISDEAGNTISWCAMAVAKDIQEGGLKGTLAFTDCIDEDGNVYLDRCCYAGEGVAKTIITL